MLRRIVTALILLPLTVIIVAFAVANRQMVTVSLDPFNAEHPAAVVTLPLFALILGLLILGVVIGGVASWLRQSRWRRTARRLDSDLSELRNEVDTLKRPAEPTNIPRQIKPPQRLKLRPPTG